MPCTCLHAREPDWTYCDQKPERQVYHLVVHYIGNRALPKCSMAVALTGSHPAVPGQHCIQQLQHQPYGKAVALNPLNGLPAPLSWV